MQRSAVGSEFVGHDGGWRDALLLQKFPHQLSADLDPGTIYQRLGRRAQFPASDHRQPRTLVCCGLSRSVSPGAVHPPRRTAARRCRCAFAQQFMPSNVPTAITRTLRMPGRNICELLWNPRTGGRLDLSHLAITLHGKTHAIQTEPFAERKSWRLINATRTPQRRMMELNK
jgi:hypothetical protein